MSFLSKTRPAGFHPTVLFFVSTFALLGVCLLVTAFRLRIEFFDTYTTLMNARVFGGGDPDEFYWKRFIFLPILLSPFYWLERQFFAEPFAFVASHLSMTAVFLAWIFIFYRWLRLWMGLRWALWGAWLMALNPLLLHYAPFVKEDIPASFFTTLAFYFYWKSRQTERPSYYWAAAASLGAAMATRYNLIPLLLSVIAAHEFLAKGIFRGRKIFFYFLLPLLLFVAVPSLAYGLRGLAPFPEAPVRFLQDFLRFSGRVFTVQMEPPLQNYLFLGQSMTWPLAAVAILGAALSVRQKFPGTFLHALWLLFIFVFQTYAVSIKEARYLFPLFPALYFFAAKGLEELDSFFKKSGWGRVLHSSVLSFTAMLLVGFLPVRNAVRECLKFRDPVYAVDFAGEAGRYAKALAEGRNLYWIGPYYALHPREYLFHPEDEVTYLYHMYNHTIRYYAGQVVTALTGDGESRRMEWDGVPTASGMIWFPKANMVSQVNDGDVFIMNLEAEDYSSRNAPRDLKPLVVQRVRKLEFDLKAASPEGFFLYTSSQHPAARLVSALTPQGFRIEGADLPFEGPAEIHPIISGALLMPERTQVSGGKLTFVNASLLRPLAIPKIALLYFDSVREFDPETMASS